MVHTSAQSWPQQPKTPKSSWIHHRRCYLCCHPPTTRDCRVRQTQEHRLDWYCRRPPQKACRIQHHCIRRHDRHREMSKGAKQMMGQPWNSKRTTSIRCCYHLVGMPCDLLRDRTAPQHHQDRQLDHLLPPRTTTTRRKLLAEKGSSAINPRM